MTDNSKLSYKDKIMLKEPKMYCVIMYNDECTTMDFVVEILTKVFHKPIVEATNIMLKIHETGKSIVGVYTYDIAVTKKIVSDNMAKQKSFPLKITIDEAIE